VYHPSLLFSSFPVPIQGDGRGLGGRGEKRAGNASMRAAGNNSNSSALPLSYRLVECPCVATANKLESIKQNYERLFTRFHISIDKRRRIFLHRETLVLELVI
jgi:hypothetical protein